MNCGHITSSNYMHKQQIRTPKEQNAVVITSDA